MTQKTGLHAPLISAVAGGTIVVIILAAILMKRREDVQADRMKSRPFSLPISS